MQTKSAFLGALFAVGMVAQISVPAEAGTGCVSNKGSAFCYTTLTPIKADALKPMLAYIPPQQKAQIIAGLAAGRGGTCTKYRSAALVSATNNVYCWKSGTDEASARLVITEPFSAIFPDLASLERTAAPGKNCVAQGKSALFNGSRVDCLPTPPALLKAISDSEAGRRSGCDGQDCVPDKFRQN